MLIVRQVSPDETQIIEGLTVLLQDVVHQGASLGFLAPLSDETANIYWEKVLASIGSSLYLWVAEADDTVVGTVQLALIEKDNGRHRAEIWKLMVLSTQRGQGIGRQLMSAAETLAGSLGRTLLVLDTEVGSPAESLYQRLGWTWSGEIPDYATSPDGRLHATVYYYKRKPKAG